MLLFFKIWLQAFERDRSFPFLLLLEFADVDFDRLGELLGTADFCDCSIALLPKLGEVEAQDVEDFYDRPLEMSGYTRYDDIFDRHSLTPADAPIRYRPAIDKLKFKTR